MSLLDLKNKSLEELEATLEKNLLKCANSIEKAVLYNYYMESLKDTQNDHIAQMVVYNKFKKVLTDKIDAHQSANASIYEKILGLKKMGYVVKDFSTDNYNSFRGQPLTQIDNLDVLNNPYNWWGYVEATDKWYCKLPIIVEEGYEGWLINGTILSDFKIVIKDNNEPYLLNVGDVIISEENDVQTGSVNVSSTYSTIKLSVATREQATDIIKRVFETFELKNEPVFIQGDGVYKYAWGGVITLPDHLN